MSRRPIPDAKTVALQRTASDPGTSAWVGANAGSGKTFVLARRVIRCLLAGTPASRLLCLTFTKAAAATMSNRVFAELGRWATMADEPLAEAIAEIEGATGPIRPERIAKARRLFAEAIETPGGLKIQTIHAFCESVLQQFPLEADLSGNFEILDDRGAREAIDRARETVTVAAAAAGPDDPLGRAFAHLLEGAAEGSVVAALGAVIAARDDLARWLREVGTLDDALDDLAGRLGVDPTLDDAALVAEMLASPQFSAERLAALVADFAASGPNDRRQADKLIEARTAATAEARLDAWWGVFFTAAGTPKAEKSLATKAIVARHPDFLERAGHETARLQGLADRRAALACHRATAALLRLGDRVIGHYEAAKRARGALDFDDLVARTADLLSHREAARWVQYKLDKGIDHVLIDEAQDTNPRQWRIVRGLTEEFFAGESARRLARTIFAVGDEKQSIYSFQGARPATFSENRRDFRRLAEAAGGRFADVALAMSFRSTPAVLSAVDAVFRDPARRARVLSDPSDYTEHSAVRARDPGRVEVWPMLRAEAAAEPEDWILPLDRPGATSPAVRLARKIADEIAALMAPGVRLAGTGAAVRPKDVIVLVRKRGGFVDAMNRVLKERGIPVAGQDRLRLTDHIAVADLLALGRAVALPEDDLSLAVVLKSPLFGRDDDDLVDLAARRGATVSLAAALAEKGAADAAWTATAARFARWCDLARRLPSYEFYARVLSADGGRRAFRARLGGEVDDVLDEFLALAIAADRGPAPSLTRFVEDLAADAPQIKRELDETRDEVRVMTVHGAKGLEAAVVFLVDDGGAPVSAIHDPALVDLPRGGGPEAAPALAWSRGRADPAIVAARRAAHRDTAAAEYLRLLYVAMTRAADRLIVCGHAGVRAPSAECWHTLVETALAGEAERIEDAGGAHRLVWTTGPRDPVAGTADAPTEQAPAAIRPAWLDRPPPGTAATRRVMPSSAEADAAAPRRGQARQALDAALAPETPERRRGLLTHRLLEVLPDLPAESRAAAARRHVAAEGGALPEAMRGEIVDEVLAILADPRFAPVFGPGSRAEAAIAGRLTARDGTILEVSGRVDRLSLGAREVLIVDYKTERVAAERARARADQIAQLALYRRLVGEALPGRRIGCALLWTALPRLDPIEAAEIDAAEARLGLAPR